jgi:hypothetical protein
MHDENYHAIITLNRFKELIKSQYVFVGLEMRTFILFTLIQYFK